MLQTSVFQTLASAKRGAKERKGVHAWHPYYASYSEAFVTSAIEFLKLNSSHILLDPWNGSGTTALVASRFGIRTLGCEINPVINIFSAAKSSYLIRQNDLIEELANKLTQKAEQTSINIQDKDTLLNFMSLSLSCGVRTFYSAINDQEYPNCPLAKGILDSFTTKAIKLNPFEAFFKAALFITSRNLAGYKGGSNPTWVKTLSEKPNIKKQELILEFKKIVNLMIQDLEDALILKTDIVLHLPLLIDSRNLPLQDNCIDGVITSPPYLTRLDYAMSTRPELLIMTDSEALRKIRENTIGSPVIVNKNIKINPKWGKTCLKLIENVQKHKSKAATSYYLPNMLQYFRDVELSLREIIRVLKPNAQALLVIQSSYFKEHEINLSQIYVELCQNLGVSSKIISREIIRGHLAHVNIKSTQYKKGKVYFEDVICLTK